MPKMRAPANRGRITHQDEAIMKKHFLAAGLLAAMAVPASAQGFYLFGDIGRTKISLDNGDFELNTSTDNFSFGAGYVLNKFISFEVASRDLGSFIAYEDQYQKSKAEFSTIQASLIATYPINSKFSVFGHAGIADLTGDEKYQDFENPEYNESNSESENRSVFGFGGNYIINDHLSLRAAYSRYAKWQDVVQLTTITAGVVYTF